jgi:hypothetical protein
MEVATPIVTDSVCRARYSAGMITSAVQICSGGNNKGACQVEIKNLHILFQFSY